MVWLRYYIQPIEGIIMWVQFPFLLLCVCLFVCLLECMFVRMYVCMFVFYFFVCLSLLIIFSFILLSCCLHIPTLLYHLLQFKKLQLVYLISLLSIQFFYYIFPPDIHDSCEFIVLSLSIIKSQFSLFYAFHFSTSERW